MPTSANRTARNPLTTQTLANSRTQELRAAFNAARLRLLVTLARVAGLMLRGAPGWLGAGAVAFGVGLAWLPAGFVVAGVFLLIRDAQTPARGAP